jgi:hypothetical protein
MRKMCSSVAQISKKLWHGASASIGQNFPITDDSLIGSQQPDIAAPQRAVIPTERSDEGSAVAVLRRQSRLLSNRRQIAHDLAPEGPTRIAQDKFAPANAVLG